MAWAQAAPVRFLSAANDLLHVIDLLVKIWRYLPKFGQFVLPNLTTLAIKFVNYLGSISFQLVFWTSLTLPDIYTSNILQYSGFAKGQSPYLPPRHVIVENRSGRISSAISRSPRTSDKQGCLPALYSCGVSRTSCLEFRSRLFRGNWEGVSASVGGA